MSSFYSVPYEGDIDQLISREEIDLKKFKQISVTSLGRCQKPVWFKVKGIKPAKKHIYPLRGIILHSRIEKYLKQLLEGELPDTGWDIEEELKKYNLPEYAIQDLIPILQKMWGNFLQYMQGWEVTATNIQLIEQATTLDLGEGFILKGRADLITNNTIIDFKSGKKPTYIQKDYKIQLLAYRRLYKDDTLKMKFVFLGGRKPEVVEIDGDKDQSLDKVIRDTVEIRKLMVRGEEPRGKFGFLCTMCDYRHICRGV